VTARVSSRAGGSGHGYWPGYALTLDEDNVQLSGLVSEDVTDEILSPYRILVVEDSPTMRDVMQLHASQFSRLFPIEMVSCETADEARAHLQASRFDLAVVDLYLSGNGTGADLVRQLRAAGDATPVIGFSVGGADARRAFLDAGADLYLDKPIMLRDVFSTLRRLVRHARRQS
jgi:two-component system, OmpR family, response regulator QseB